MLKELVFHHRDDYEFERKSWSCNLEPNYNKLKNGKPIPCSVELSLNAVLFSSFLVLPFQFCLFLFSSFFVLYFFVLFFFVAVFLFCSFLLRPGFGQQAMFSYWWFSHFQLFGCFWLVRPFLAGLAVFGWFGCFWLVQPFSASLAIFWFLVLINYLYFE
eukprot:Phypoly_transcript_12586.p1 GENE.Phypoly_transcript_12586~~Phypoly_transcript_12586.p1  ORF type:complete len:159 (-),score=3.16 Phypoly_transcript_12586:578-1054(-)